MLERIRFLNPKEHTKTITYQDGMSVTVRREFEQLPTPGETADHEAAHVVASDEIEKATIIPDGNALGVTIPKTMTYEAAAAAEALGHKGTSWDMMVVKFRFGVPYHRAIAGARARLRGKEDLRKRIAGKLQLYKTIYQRDVDQTKYEVHRERYGIHDVEVKFNFGNGQTYSYTTTSYNNIVEIDGNTIFQSNLNNQKNSEKLAA